jgi:hypothetical protein
MLVHFLKKTDFEMLLDFMTPVFFEVVPSLGMARVLGTLLKDLGNKKKFSSLKKETESLLREVGFHWVDRKHFGRIRLEILSETEKVEFGEKILRLYFAQLLMRPTAFLDLRMVSFGEGEAWLPKPIYYRWENDFLEGIRAVYLGFFLENDLLLKRGLQQLNLEHAENVFKNHFGEDKQEAILFTLSHLTHSLHSVFMSCKNQRAKMHPDFFAFGFYLLSLYETLESLQVKLNVRQTFLRSACG